MKHVLKWPLITACVFCLALFASCSNGTSDNSEESSTSSLALSLNFGGGRSAAARVSSLATSILSQFQKY